MEPKINHNCMTNKCVHWQFSLIHHFDVFSVRRIFANLHRNRNFVSLDLETNWHDTNVQFDLRHFSTWTIPSQIQKIRFWILHFEFCILSVTTVCHWLELQSSCQRSSDTRTNLVVCDAYEHWARIIRPWLTNGCILNSSIPYPFGIQYTWPHYIEWRMYQLISHTMRSNIRSTANCYNAIR